MGGSIYHCYFLLMATDQAHVALAKYKKFPWMIWNVSRNKQNAAVGVKNGSVLKQLACLIDNTTTMVWSIL